MEQKPVRTG